MAEALHDFFISFPCNSCIAMASAYMRIPSFQSPLAAAADALAGDAARNRGRAGPLPPPQVPPRAPQMQAHARR